MNSGWIARHAVVGPRELSSPPRRHELEPLDNTQRRFVLANFSIHTMDFSDDICDGRTMTRGWEEAGLRQRPGPHRRRKSRHQLVLESIRSCCAKSDDAMIRGIAVTNACSSD
jgi:hypothetical protein